MLAEYTDNKSIFIIFSILCYWTLREIKTNCILSDAAIKIRSQFLF